MTPQAALRQRYVWKAAMIVGAAVLLVWTVFPFVWILLTSLKSSGDIISVPPKFVFTPTFDNYAALVLGEQGEITPPRAPTFRCSF